MEQILKITDVEKDQKLVPGPTLRIYPGTTKRCPKCNHIERNSEFTFCTSDGSTLVADDDFDSRGEETRISNYLGPGNYARTARITSNSPTAATGKLRIKIKRRLRIDVLLAAPLAIALLACGVYVYISYKHKPVISSLAVLPFLNIKSDQDLEYISDGITDSLISNLSQLPNLNLKARSSVFRFKGKDLPARTVGADLNVQAILNGRMSQRGSLLTLSLELVDVQSENVMWSKQYNREQSELISLQSEIVRDVSDELRLKLAPAKERKDTKEYTSSEAAYELYLKGRFYWNKRTLRDLEKAIECFKQSLKIDPNYALAYSGLADSYVVTSLYQDDGGREARSQAREAAMRALILDPDLAEAHTTIGFVNTHDYDFVSAEREYRRAIELNPNYATAHQWYGELLSHLARHEESLAELQRALEIDPFSLIINNMYGNSLFYSRRYDEAIAQLKKTLELDTDFAITHQCIARVYQATGQYTEAVAEFARYQELIGQNKTAAQVRESFARGGWHGFLRSMTGDQRPANLSEYEKTVFLTALGEKDKALAAPDKAYERLGCMLKTDPLLDPLRDDSRFAELLRRVGLA